MNASLPASKIVFSPPRRGFRPSALPARSLPTCRTVAAGMASTGRRAWYCGSLYGINMLSASLPPLRYRTTRLRRDEPCARARSERNAGAAKLKVNAATPPRMNSRRATPGGFAPPAPPTRSLAGSQHPAWLTRCARSFFISHQLVFTGSDNEVRQPRGFRRELGVRPRPRPAGARVVDQRVIRIGGKRRRRHPIERPRDQSLG